MVLLSSSIRSGCSASITRNDRLHAIHNARKAASNRQQKRSYALLKAVAEPSDSVPFASSAEHLSEWSVDSWKNFTALQQPNYPDKVCAGIALIVGMFAYFTSKYCWRFL